MQTFPFEVQSQPTAQGAFTVTISVKVPENATPVDVINYIRSLQIKQDLQGQWMRTNAPNHGLEVRGGPRPVMEVPGDLTSKVVAYEQDFRLCPRV